MSGAIPPLPQYVFMAWCLVKHRDKFTFTFYLCLILQFGFYYVAFYVFFHNFLCYSTTSSQSLTLQRSPLE
jgi:hypothetical protein